MNTEEKIVNANKTIKTFLLIWLINLPYFTLSIWFEAYCQNIGHWGEGPLEIMAISGGGVKFITSLVILGLLLERYTLVKVGR
jgi:hypothetical protein